MITTQPVSRPWPHADVIYRIARKVFKGVSSGPDKFPGKPCDMATVLKGTLGDKRPVVGESLYFVTSKR